MPARALQVAAVLRRLEAAVSDPHHPGELPRPQVVLDLADQLLIVGVPRPAPHADRDSGAGDRHPDHHLGQIIAMILALAISSERFAHDVAVLVELVVLGLVALEVGRGGVKEQQVNLEVQQIGGREIDGLGKLVLDFQKPVHRPVAGVLVELRKPLDPRPLCQPLARRELRERLKRPVGDHREDHPLRKPVEPAALKQPLKRAVDLQRPPQPIQHPRAADRAGLQEAKLADRCRSERLAGLQRALQRADQPHDRRPVQLVLAPEAVQHADLRLLGYRVPHVVRQLQVADAVAVLRPPLRPPEIHT